MSTELTSDSIERCLKLYDEAIDDGMPVVEAAQQMISDAELMVPNYILQLADKKENGGAQ